LVHKSFANETMRNLALILVALLAIPSTVFAEAQLNGQPITKARQILIKSGWQPNQTDLMTGEDNNEPENQRGNAGAMYRAGLIEVEMCNGTSKNFCFFNYRSKGKCLRLLTQGEFSLNQYEPMVIKQSSECPPREALKAAVKSQ
jgi:hypothetical protein